MDGIRAIRRCLAAATLLAAAVACGAPPDDGGDLAGAPGGDVRFQFPSLPETPDGSRYVSILFSAKKLDARNRRFTADAQTSIVVGPVAASTYDVNIELRHTSNDTLDRVRTIELEVGETGGEATVRFDPGS